MTIGQNDLLVLDTNILVHWVRQDATGTHLQQTYFLDERPERPLYSSIAEGEMLGLAKCWKWGTAKVKTLQEILAELVRVETGLTDIVSAYADLYFEDQAVGGNTGENDLWIAACAKAAGAVLLTCDSDFLWMSPRLVRVEYVPETR